MSEYEQVDGSYCVDCNHLLGRGVTHEGHKTLLLYVKMPTACNHINPHDTAPQGTAMRCDRGRVHDDYHGANFYDSDGKVWRIMWDEW